MEVRKRKVVLCFYSALPLLSALTGCGIGNAPTPMSPEEVQDALSKAKPEDQINWINRSPMPPEEKKRKIEEIEKKYGIKADAVTGPSGAPMPAGQ